jgi:hypothetical protein
MLRGSAQAIDPVAEIDARQIAREDFLLGQPRFEPQRNDDFLRLAPEAPVARQEAGLRELLGDRAAALAHSPGSRIGDHCPADAAQVDAPVAVEAAVLDGNECGRGQRVELRGFDRGFLDRAAPGDLHAFLRQQQQRRVVERLKRTRQGRGDDQPQQGDEENSGDRIEDDSAAAALRL